MNSTKEVIKISKSLKLSLWDGFLYSLMMGLGESYLPAFSLSLGFSEFAVGVISTLPIVTGAFLQLATPRALKQFKNSRRWVVSTAILQAVAFLPLLYMSITQQKSIWIMLLALTLYWGAGFSSGPVWNYWMGDLIPESVKNKYFALRTKYMQMGIFLGLVVGGVSLHNKVSFGPFASVFSVLFLFAFSLRLSSSFLLSRHHYEPKWEESHPHTSVKESWFVFTKNEVKRDFFISWVLFQTCVYLTAPFVVPYMLKQLKLDYSDFMWAVGSLYIGKVSVLTYLEKYKAQFNGFQLMAVGLLMVAPAPMLWPISRHLAFVILLQLYSGIAWAMVDLGISLIFFKDLHKNEKIPFMLIYNVINSGATLIGVYLAKLFIPLHPVIQDYYNLFLVGGMLRFLMALPVIFKAKKWSQDALKGSSHEI